MDDIPADVLAAAYAAHGYAVGSVQPSWVGKMTGITARAIMSERERCATVAERTYAKDAFHFELGTAIAAAIRSGS